MRGLGKRLVGCPIITELDICDVVARRFRIGVRCDQVVLHHRGVRRKFELFGVALRRDAQLHVQPLLLEAEVVDLRTKGQILRAIEVNSLLFGVSDCHIISTHVDLVEIGTIVQHLPLCFPKKTLDVLRLQLV